MSELTRCNFCILRDYRRRAQKDGTELQLATVTEGPLVGWTLVVLDGIVRCQLQVVSDACAC